MKINPKYSWLTNKLIKMRDVVYIWIKLRVENGRSCRFWTDNWSPYGSLDNYLMRVTNSGFAIPKTATLYDLLVDGQWVLPPARSNEFLQVQIYLTTLSLTEEEDTYEWAISDLPSTRYSTGEVYDQLRHEGEVVSWSKVVWISGGIPKHSFLTWLFILNHCPTRDRMLRCGIQTDSSCLLCNAHQESRDNLFFLCPYAWDLWLSVSN